MKLVIQVPCFNEEDFLLQTIDDLPKKIDGIDEIEILVIDDGSTDRTVDQARKAKVDHVVSHPNRKGLARAFKTGIESSLEIGADIIVNTDADNQYKSEYIPALIKPIMDGSSEMVIGVRDTDSIEHFSRSKKILQKLGSKVVRVLSGSNISDTTSGFRAYSRESAMRLNQFNEYTYTLDTIIQAGHKNISMTSVPIKTNPDLRASRLVKSNFSYVTKNALGIIRIFLIYRPLKAFFIFGAILFFLGFMLGVRYLALLFAGDGSGNVQSLILSSVLMITGFHTIIFSFLADLMSSNRKLLEEVSFKLNKIINK